MSLFPKKVGTFLDGECCDKFELYKCKKIIVIEEFGEIKIPLFEFHSKVNISSW